jgi:putative protease
MRDTLKKPELLAPAGTKEAFIGAINAGANAIFMAGHRFGARAFAENFNQDDLKQAIEYAHLRGVSVFIVVNTLTFDDEVEDLLSYTDELVKAHVDALIVQDIGMISIFAQRYPNTAIHASTQVNAHNIHHVQFLKELGVKRVILARETSLEVIKAIKRTVDIELEVFIHGALCVSFSGNCLISSILNKRSGNRGECAYNCRLPYKLIKDKTVIGEESYLMSAKDLMTLEHIDALIEAGIDSFKIEGRMRKKEYVTQTTMAYRQAIDAYYEHKNIDFKIQIDKLKRVFNRDYTKGYMLKEVPKDLNNDFRPNHMGVPIGKVIAYEKNLALVQLNEGLKNGDGFRIVGKHDYGNMVTFMKRKNNTIIKEAFKGETIYLEVKETVYPESILYKTLDSDLEKDLVMYQSTAFKLIPLSGIATAYVGKPMHFSISDGDHTVEVSTENPLEYAMNQPATETTIAQNLSKLGGTPFYFDELSIYTDGACFIPIKELNELRRIAMEELTALRIGRKEAVIQPYVIQNGFNYDDTTKLVARVHTLEQLNVAYKLGLDEIYYEDIIEVNKNDYPNTPIRPVTKRIIEDVQGFEITGPTMVSELGGIYQNQKRYPIVTDEFVNITNIYTAALISTMNVKRIALSSELDQDHVLRFSKRYFNRFGSYPNLEMVVYGHKDLMISKYCPVAKTFGYKPNCRLCFKDQYYLQDHIGKYALLNDGHCNMRVMDPKPLLLIDYLETLKAANINTFRMDFTTETEKEMKSIIYAFKSALEQKPYRLDLPRFRTGHFE